MSGGVVGIVGALADGAFAEQGGLSGLLSGADLNQMAEQLDMSDPSNVAFAAWAKEYAPEKVDGTQSIWDAPNDVYTFRNAVTSLPGYGVSWYWKDVIGKIDGNYQLKVATSGSSGGGTQKDLSGGKVFVWPWEPGAFKAAAWWMWLVWLAIPTALILVLWLIFRKKKWKKWRKPKWMRRRQRQRRF